ncbi:MAG TPA: NAD(P)/FAD-dependent oxidoreductase [Candidatus Bilamarchaeum sp.]|nr:NAD(P)/FAD-dependent oxidoreductase [Candidatus Bilamarchaeum sp.]
MPDSYDVIIVGGGPGGLSCARTLSGSGLRVLVLEKNERVGKKICSGEISRKVFPGHEFDRGRPWTAITVGTDDTVRKIAFDRPYLWTVGRFELESWIMAGAEADIRFSEPVTEITPETVHTTKGSYNYKHLVGADGSFSVVRKYLGLPSKEVAGWAFHYLADSECPEFCMYWLPKSFPAAYGYMMSKSRGKTMMGLAWRGEEFDHATAGRAKGWIAKTFKADTSKLRSEAMKGNADYRGWKFGNVYLVGDAGGFLNPLTTEGIHYAIRSGDAVARHIRGDPDGARILSEMARAHKWQAWMYGIATDTRLPFCWFINWVLRDPRSGLRKRIFDWVFWKFMDG